MNFGELFASFALSPRLSETRIAMVRKALLQDKHLTTQGREVVVQAVEGALQATLISLQTSLARTDIPPNVRDAYVIPMLTKQLEMTFAAMFRDSTTELAARARQANDAC